MGTHGQIMEIEKTRSVGLEVELSFDLQKKIFTAHKEFSRNILQYFKEKKFLLYVLPEFFPEKFTGEILINQHSQKNETAYIVRFHLDIQICEIDLRASEKMEGKVARFLNRSIDETEKKKLKFMVEIPKNSKYIKEITKEKITLWFF